MVPACLGTGQQFLSASPFSQGITAAASLSSHFHPFLLQAVLPFPSLIERIEMKMSSQILSLQMFPFPAQNSSTSLCPWHSHNSQAASCTTHRENNLQILLQTTLPGRKMLLDMKDILWGKSNLTATEIRDKMCYSCSNACVLLSHIIPPRLVWRPLDVLLYHSHCH